MRQCCLKWKDVSLCCEGIETEEKQQQQRDQKWNENGSAAASYKSSRLHEPATELSGAKAQLDPPQPPRLPNHPHHRLSAEFLLEADLRHFPGARSARPQNSPCRELVMDAVRKAKDRLAKYPVLVAKCSSAAAVYAACVTRDLDIQKHACDKEFQAFKQCLVAQAKAMKTRMWIIEKIWKFSEENKKKKQ